MFGVSHALVVVFGEIEFFAKPYKGGGVFGDDDGDVDGGGVVEAEGFDKGDIEVGVGRKAQVGIGLGVRSEGGQRNRRMMRWLFISSGV